MRNLSLILTFTLLAGPAAAQTRPAAPPQAPAILQTLTPSVDSKPTGLIDVGVRTSNITGDDARYNRYRDMGDGLFIETGRLQFQKQNWFLSAGTDHAGRKDARYDIAATRPGLLKLWGRWDQVPMLMSRTTQTLYMVPAPGVFRLDDVLQQTMQATAAAGQTAVLTNFVNTSARAFPIESRRHIGSGGVQYLPDTRTTLSLDVQRTNREGVIPYGATFGFANTIELPAPVSHRLTEVNAAAERQQGRWLLRLGSSASLFTNNVQSLTWDNPYRFTDSATAPSQGRLATVPSNTYMNVNGSASVKLSKHSRATVFLSAGILDDRGATILPQTINTALAVVPLNRTTVDGHATTKAANVSFTSRPTTNVNVNVRYRYYDYKNETPLFTNTSRVNYDTTLLVLPVASVTERHGGARQSFDADVTMRVSGSTLGAGYTMKKAEYEERIFESSTENTARLIYDAFSSQWFTLHGKYEHAIRRGQGLNTAELSAIGEQPGMRTFDIADRDRDLFTMTGTITPASTVSINLSAGTGKDAYPHSQFGLFNAKHGIYSIGIDAVPTDRITAGVSYDYEDYKTLQWSRQANPGVQQNDASRDWSTDGHDRVHSVLANLAIARIADKVDLRTSYDFNRGRTFYVYGTGSVLDRTLPEGSTVIASTLPNPVQLPPVMSELSRGTVDGVYSVTSKVGIGFTYWYERYKVDDFALDAEAIPRINLPGALLLGYQYLPYTAHTFWTRLIVKW